LQLKTRHKRGHKLTRIYSVGKGSRTNQLPGIAASKLFQLCFTKTHPITYHTLSRHGLMFLRDVMAVPNCLRTLLQFPSHFIY